MATTFLRIPELSSNPLKPEITVNYAKDILDGAIAGTLNVSMTPDTAYTLTNSGDYPREWQHHNLVIDVANTTSTELRLSDTYCMKYSVDNKTGFDIVFKTVSGTGVTIPAGSIYKVYSDGTDIRRVT